VGAEAAKAVVTAKPLGEKKGDKIKMFKYRPKSGYAKRAGHRQILTMLEIEDVKFGAAPKRAAKAKAEVKVDTEAEPKVEEVPAEAGADVVETADSAE
jgi:hypothetical protein